MPESADSNHLENSPQHISDVVGIISQERSRAEQKSRQVEKGFKVLTPTHV